MGPRHRRRHRLTLTSRITCSASGGGVRPRRAMRNARFGRRPVSRVRRVLLLRRLQRPVPPGQGVRGRAPTLLDRGEGVRGRAPALRDRGGCWFGWPRRPGRPGRTGRDGVGWRQTAEIARPRIGAELPTQLSIDVEVPRGAAGRGGDDLEYCGAVAVVDRCGHRCGHCVEVPRGAAGRGGDDLEYCGAVAVVDRCGHRCGHYVHVRRHFLGRQ
jgi:hypothetical protein